MLHSKFWEQSSAAFDSSMWAARSVQLRRVALYSSIAWSDFELCDINGVAEIAWNADFSWISIRLAFPRSEHDHLIVDTPDYGVFWLYGSIFTT